MCGIAGIIGLKGRCAVEELERRVKRMTKEQMHRGPDGEGYWSGTVAGACVSLGHVRLAIIDLSDAGRQPMVFGGGRYVLVYNGEVYNYRELRTELEAHGHAFASQSDTEVVLQALVAWGTRAFSKFNGMWAIAFLDAERGVLLLSRDRFGEKPLYLHRQGDVVYFASEIKAICVGTERRFPVNAIAVGRFLGQSLLDAQDETFFVGINRLPAGHYLEIILTGHDRIPVSEPRPYWTLPDGTWMAANQEDVVEQVRELFLDAVSIRLRSDVPVGVLLSGGIDSSSIAAAVRAAQPNNPLHVVSAVSDDPRYNEEPYIERVATFLGLAARTVQLRADPDEAFRMLERVTWFNDEPVGGFSSVAHFLLMERARDLGLKVILSGQGADEILCGYRKYQVFHLQSLARQGQYARLACSLVGLARPSTGFLSDFKLSEARRYLPRGLGIGGANILGPLFQDDGWILELGVGNDGVVERQKRDLYLYSVPVLTHYEDRMSMALSREVRLPFLDYRLVSLLLPLEPAWKLRGGWTKWILRKAMEPLLPKEVVWRGDKKPFSTPAGEWLRNEWRRKIEDLFMSGDMLTAGWGLVDRGRLCGLYRAYCRRSRLLESRDIFNPLALEIWARQYAAYLAEPLGVSSDSYAAALGS